jgi:putative copper export protein
MLKLCLFSILFGFAVLKRCWLTPVLRAEQADAEQRTLIVDPLLQTDC